MEEDFDLVVECCHCGTENGIYLDDEDFDTVEELEIRLENVVSTDQAVDYIYNELVKDGFAPNVSAVRQVLKYFHSFCAEKFIEMGDKE